MREIRKSGSEGSGEETTVRKAGIGASPLTLRVRGSSIEALATPQTRESGRYARHRSR
jgi:hypothetical protein